jgi:sensor histidine kinase regulating citrate/malate metabolism
VKPSRKLKRRLGKIQRSMDRALHAIDHEKINRVTASDGITEPTTYDEAMKSPQCAQWVKAMQDEMDSLVENETWTTDAESL